MQELLSDLFAFLAHSPSPWHAAAQAAARLEAAGYTRLEETAPWALRPGQGYFVTRGGASVLAWRMPAGIIEGWRITASHADSPTWRLKTLQTPVAQGVCRLDVEGYGGMLMATWFDRPLTLAGRAVVRTADGVKSRLVCPDRDLFIIPSLAKHFDPTANDGHKYDPQRELQPIYGPEGCRPLPALLAEELGTAPGDILDADLVLAVRQPPVRLGPEGEWFAAPRIDDMACAATTLRAFLAAAPCAPAGCAPLWALLDSEEIGSGTRQGAAATFVRDTLARILEGWEACTQPGAAAMAATLANSFCLSCDNAHATHPAHPEVADPVCPVRLGGGVVLKYSARQSYATTAVSGAVFKELCRRSGVPVQVFVNRAGQRGGGTLGNLLARTVPVPMADIGLPQLAMHAAVETAAVADAAAMVQAVDAFYRADLRAAADGAYRL